MRWVDALRACYRRPLSVPVYFAWVVLVTALGFAIMLVFRPALAYSVREWLGLERHLQATPNSFYTVRVAPLLDEHCTSCHGARRQKAKLRLDSFAAVIRGGRHGPVIKPGNVAHSELFARINLPAADGRVMPPESKPALTRDEVTVLQLWIAAGASGMQPVDQIKGAPKPVMQIRFTQIDPRAVEQARASRSAMITALQSRYPNVIAYESRTSANLELKAALLGSSFADADLAAIGAVSDSIVWADLSGTAVTDASAAVLAAMRQLRVLRLTNTKISDATIHALVELSKLESLTVAGTGATSSSLRALEDRHIKIYDGSKAEHSGDNP